jgi:hypothetical protein
MSMSTYIKIDRNGKMTELFCHSSLVGGQERRLAQVVEDFARVPAQEPGEARVVRMNLGGAHVPQPLGQPVGRRNPDTAPLSAFNATTAA